MKRIILISCITFLFQCSSNPPTPQHFAKVNGKQIIDKEGNVLFIRAVGLGNWLLPEGYMWKFGKEGDRPRKIEKRIIELIGEGKSEIFWQEFRQNYITEADIARIKDLGFNTVRPAMNWRLFMDEKSGTFTKEGFELIDRLVDWCNSHQVYIILDMHAAPGGQTGANIDDSEADFPELFRNPEMQDWFVALWVEIAKRYKNEPIIIAYDLMNEPLPKQYSEFYSDLEPLYRRTVTAIREIDPNHMITLEGAHWSTDFSVFGPPFDDNTFYQFHKYWSLPDTKSIEPYLEFREKYNVPLWLGESGENSLDWYWCAYQLFKDHDIGWLFWPWKKMDTQNTPYSIAKPNEWDVIAEFTRGGPKPDPEMAQVILDQFLENIKLENCRYYPDVVNAVFRRVPAKIEAENYGHLGEGKSYYVKSSQNADVFRVHEPVPIVALDSLRTRDADYAVSLKETEWLVFEINSTIDQILKLNLKAKAMSADVDLHFQLDDRFIELSKNYNTESFTYNNSNPFLVTKGQHSLKLFIDRGQVLVDWFNIQ